MAAFNVPMTLHSNQKIWPKYYRNCICQIKTLKKRLNFYWFNWVFDASSTSCSDRNFSSSLIAFLFQSFLIVPVPAGTNLPTITFSFSPWRISTLPLIAASVRTLVVSWNDAAEINDSVWSEALVIPH